MATPSKRGDEHRATNSAAWRAVPIVVILVIAAGIAYWWWNGHPAANVATAPEPVASAPVAPAPVATASAPSEPAIQYPLQSASAAAPIEPSGIAGALADLLGRKAVTAFLQVDDFPHRFVATVDNLGRSYAPTSVWPINPTPGRFTVEKRGGSTVISADNGRRYTPLVLLAESVDTRKAVDLYIRMYPLFQRAYQDLGFPKGYFNDRLIQVIDLLLASPDPGESIRVQLIDVKGPEPSATPWVRYEFVDPALESLTAGQKIMVRIGSVNERRLKAKLTALRKELLGRVVPR